MIEVEHFINFLKKKKITFFSGVPDSLLKNISYYLERKKKDHVLAFNEGNAVSIGMGYYLSTKKIPCIYFQNSGLGNAINPLISIAHKKVYSIPLFLMIGWRGSPEVHDEPQHQVKGKITKEILDLLNIKYCILDSKNDLKKLGKLLNYAKKNNTPVACLLRKNNFSKIKKTTSVNKKNYISRIKFIKTLLSLIKKNTKIISTTGYTSRELFEARRENVKYNGSDFYMIGGMGHSSTLALGFSLKKRNQVICLDGDGSVLMHMGSLRSCGLIGKKNFKHILLNNNSHESVGGQPTFAFGINFKKVVLSLGYRKYFVINSIVNLDRVIKNFLHAKGPCFLEVKISEGSLINLPRPKNLIKIKNFFMS